MSANHFPIHPAADLFPMLDSTGMQALAADIAASGLRTPVALWNGQVIDGRNRLEACRIATVEPRCETMQFADNAECVRYIVSTNLHRRHLTDEQRDQIGARLVTMGQGGDRANPQNAGLIGVDAAAGLVSSTPARIERARTIERADPELAAQVRAGTITKGGALKQIRERAKVHTDPDQAADSVVDNQVDDHHDDGVNHEVDPYAYLGLDGADDLLVQAKVVFDHIRNLRMQMNAWGKKHRHQLHPGNMDPRSINNLERNIKTAIDDWSGYLSRHRKAIRVDRRSS